MSTTRRFRLAAAATALALGLLAGCGSNEEASQAATTPTPVVRDLSSYDAFVLASAENNPLFADVYAIRFQPFAIDRITSGKRISSLGADEDHVLVAAADGDVDRLAQVTGAGELLPVPGLGRPHAFEPEVVDDVMYFQDIDEVERKDDKRYFAYDLKKQTKKLLFRSVEDRFGLTPMSDGRVAYGIPKDNSPGEVVVRSKSGKQTRYPFKGYAGGTVGVGRDWLALTLAGANAEAEDGPADIVLLDPDSGRKQRIPGLQVLSWSPDGTRLLARRTASTTDSALVLIDPAKPNAPVDVHTVPGLTIFGASWVRGEAVSTS